MPRNQKILFTVITLVLVLAAAGVSAFVTRDMVRNEQAQPIKKTASVKHAPRKDDIAWNQPAPVQAQQPQPVRNCDDGNVVGYLAGGVAGGIAGNQVGKGKGNTAATIGGTLGGAYLGGQYLPTRNVTCR